MPPGDTLLRLRCVPEGGESASPPAEAHPRGRSLDWDLPGDTLLRLSYEARRRPEGLLKSIAGIPLFALESTRGFSEMPLRAS